MNIESVLATKLGSENKVSDLTNDNCINSLPLELVLDIALPQ